MTDTRGRVAGPAERPARFGPQIYKFLKEQLLGGAYECGTKLSVNAIREEFGTSRHPVLDAMRMLDADGLVEVLPQVGCRVRSYSAEDVEDFFTFFGRLEGVSAGFAAIRRTDAQLERLFDLVGPVTGDGDLTAAEKYRSLNTRFHGVVHEMAASPIMEATCSRHWDLADFMVNTVGGVTSLEDTLDERFTAHRAIADAIAAGNAGAAERAAREHVEHSLHIIGDRIRRRGERAT